MLTLQFVPYEAISKLDSDNKIKKLLRIIKENKIILMQGRLKPEEETDLIQKTMEGINGNFRGIELCTIYQADKSNKFNSVLRAMMVKMFMGDREGFTIIGPATVIKEIKRDPNKIELLTKNLKKPRKRRR